MYQFAVTVSCYWFDWTIASKDGVTFSRMLRFRFLNLFVILYKIPAELWSVIKLCVCLTTCHNFGTNQKLTHSICCYSSIPHLKWLQINAQQFSPFNTMSFTIYTFFCISQIWPLNGILRWNHVINRLPTKLNWTKYGQEWNWGMDLF